jgi:hypothetical protein
VANDSPELEGIEIMLPTPEEYAEVLAEKLTPEVWEGILATVLSDAQAGDALAREWVGRWALDEELPPLPPGFEEDDRPVP